MACNKPEIVLSAKAGNPIRQLLQSRDASQTYWLAYSGGVDSQVLLHMLLEQMCLETAPCVSSARTETTATVRPEERLSSSVRAETTTTVRPEERPQDASRRVKLNIIHLHHGLSPNADSWLQFCEQVAIQHDLPFYSKQVSLKPGKDDSLEALARQARYSWFSELMSEDDILLTAHHADDQAETLLLQLLRGSGPKGLSAMPIVKPFSNGWHARPLLGMKRDEILAYAKEHQLDWVEDESNANLAFARNYLRHQVMPSLKQRWPQSVTTLGRSAEHCARDQGLLNEYADLLLAKVKGMSSNSLSQDLLCQLSRDQQSLVLRRWVEIQGYRLPEQGRLYSILDDVLTAAPDRHPCVSWGEVSIRRFRGELILRKEAGDISEQSLCGHESDVLAAKQVLGRGLKYPPEALRLAYRQGGERIGVSGGFSKTLKNLFQEWAVPQWERSTVPLLYWRDQLVAVVGYHYAPEHQVAEGEHGWEYHIQKSPPISGDR